ncbi:MAG: hypothetical protein M0R22_01560 [Dehalococcoidia bacterium]|nr:hypothetical protein [Dehalococcoidia bacterium]
MAPLEKRRVALETLRAEVPSAAWRLLLSLLPSQRQSTMGSYKPKWRTSISEEQPAKVTPREYWQQVEVYASLAVDMAKDNNTRLLEMTSHLESLPPPLMARILEHLSSPSIVGLSEDERVPLWANLTQLVSKHRRHAAARWALNPEVLSTIEQTASRLAPSSRPNLHRRLFEERAYDLFDGEGNWEEQQRRLEELREAAVRDILQNESADAVVRFAESVESSPEVGHILGLVAEPSVDSLVLPCLLESENRRLVNFACGYVRGRYAGHGWSWVDQIDKRNWSETQLGLFLGHLPFAADTWKRVQDLLEGAEYEYWRRVQGNPYQSPDDLDTGVDQLLKYGRPLAAIDCMWSVTHSGKVPDAARAVRALLAALTSTEESHSGMAHHAIVDLIKTLQDNPNTSADDLTKIEWAYLPLLQADGRVSPRTLERRLASDPEFFCEAIRMVYRSKTGTEAKTAHSDVERAMAEKAYSLLHEWRTPPGLQPDGSFSGEKLLEWLGTVKESSRQSGHLEVALTHLGSVLYHCPLDSDGLWLHRSAADVLNAKDAEDIRSGFATAIFNSRGVHSVDPTAKPELALSAQYRRKADQAEDAGYHRLATTMRGLAESYERDARRIVEEHGGDGRSDS